MTFITYKDHRFNKDTEKLIETCNVIIADYEAQGYRLTIRQLYYQLVSVNYFPNHERSYQNLIKAMNNARLAGRVSWDAIHDATRFVRGKNHWDHPRDFLADTKRSFWIDMWQNQPNYVEVWIEKDALLGVVERPCWELGVPFMSCRGYMSQSEEWASANRFSDMYHAGRNPTLIYLGDHDPSGLDMTRDHVDRLAMFLEREGVEVDVRRIALNLNQVREYNPPPNPTKVTDSRTNPYVAKFGKTCWELDALKPSVIDALVRQEIDALRDPEKWREMEEKDAELRRVLDGMIADGVSAYDARRDPATKRFL